MESNTMQQAPRPFTTTFFKLKELITSIIQGLGITLGTLGVYQLSVYLQYDENTTRTMVFVTLITANIFLTLVNRSFYYSMVTTARYKNNLILVIIAATIALSAVLLFIPVCSRFFQFEPLQLNQFVICIATGFISVTWYEIVKWIKRNKKA
jgi:Ca2+-transporting ATPase